MRDVLLLLVGFVLGVGVMLVDRPRIPSGIITGSAPITVRISSGYLSTVVQRRVDGLAGVSVRNVVISTQPPQVLIARANAGVGPVSAPVTLEVQPLAVSGAPQVRLIQADVGPVPVPSILTSAVADAINSSMRRAVPRNAQVTAVSVLPDGVELWVR